jgi:hypothetical protein
LALSGLDANFLYAVDINNAALTATAGGSADAITATYSPAPTALVAGLTLYVRAAQANATTTPQFSPNGLTGKVIVKNNNQALSVGDIAGAGHWLQLVYDATNGVWELMNPALAKNIAGGTQGQVPVQSAVGTTTFMDSSFGFKNRIINGAMVIDQRNAGAAVTPTTNVYSLDRWEFYVTQSSKVTFQQNAGSVTPPAGFKNYLGFTVGASANVTVGATDLFLIDQYIEGYNIADLGFGAAGASTVTLSFWVRSSLTGTFGGSFTNSGNSRSYPFTYTISSANTWEQKTITVAGDTSGTWLSTNGTGLGVRFSIGTGSTYLGTAGSWSGTGYFGATGQTNLVTTNSATFYITGVQLEKGSTATSFDYRPYGTELALCQRYYETGTLYYEGYADLVLVTSVGGSCGSFKVTKRAIPTMTYGAFASGYHSAIGGTRNTYVDCIQRYCNVITATGECLGYEPWTASAEL